MEKFKLTLFGGFHLADPQGQPLTPSSRKAKALLAWLALTPDRQHPREKIAGLLWPDSDETQARHSLRQTLVDLHRYLPEELGVLRATRDWLLLDSTLMTIDVQTFNVALTQDDEAAHDQAINLYQGELLEGCNPRSDMFSDWLEPYRNEYSLRIATLLRQRISSLLEQKDFERSLHYAARLVAMDPLQEAGYRALMQAHAGIGDHAAALLWYQRCQTVLEQELGVSPSPETEALLAQLDTAQHNLAITSVTNPTQQCIHSPSGEKPDNSKRILCLAQTALEGVICHHLGHSFLIRGGNTQEKNDLLEKILATAQKRGFNCQRHKITSSGADHGIAPVGWPKTGTFCLLIVEHIHLAGADTLKSLAHLISTTGNSSTLLIMTSRLEGEPLDPAWRGAMRGAPLTTIDL